MSTENKAHDFIIAAKLFSDCGLCVHPIEAETVTISKDWVLTMGFFRQALGFLCPPRRDFFIFKRLGFIIPHVYHWDFTVPEVNIYYY